MKTYNKIIETFNSLKKIGIPMPNDIENCPHYVFTATEKEPLEDRKKFKELNLPHDCFLLTCFIESIESTLIIEDLGNSISLMYYCTKLSPDTLTLAENKEGYIEVRGKLTTGEQALFIVNNLFWLLNRLNDRRVISGLDTLKLVKASKKLNSNKVKRKPYNKTVIRLAYKNDSTVKSNRHIAWDYSFRVRGHWRYLPDSNGIGKNRKGLYIEKGRTWVIPHLKNEGKEMLNKTRIIKG